MNELCKIVLLAYIGEKIVTNIDNEKIYLQIRNALDFCWKWVESKQADEEKIFKFLDDEKEEDLVGYMLSADNEKDKKVYGIILGVVSYISHNILETNKSPIPQFLEGTDNKYYNCIISDVVQCNIIDNVKEKMSEVIKYCEDKIVKKHFLFAKSEIMNL